jgi:hypothetical protein
MSKRYRNQTFFAGTPALTKFSKEGAAREWLTTARHPATSASKMRNIVLRGSSLRVRQDLGCNSFQFQLFCK